MKGWGVLGEGWEWVLIWNELEFHVHWSGWTRPLLEGGGVGRQGGVLQRRSGGGFKGSRRPEAGQPRRIYIYNTYIHIYIY